MFPPGKLAQHIDCLFRTARLAENLAFQSDNGIGRKHRCRGKIAKPERGITRFCFGLRDASNIVIRLFIGMSRFVHGYVAARVGAHQQHLEIDTDLFEQFAAARALGSQIDAWLGNHGSKDNPSSELVQVHVTQDLARYAKNIDLEVWNVIGQHSCRDADRLLFTVIRVIVHQAVCPIQLFGKQHPHKCVRQGKCGQGQLLMCVMLE